VAASAVVTNDRALSADRCRFHSFVTFLSPLFSVNWFSRATPSGFSMVYLNKSQIERVSPAAWHELLLLAHLESKGIPQRLLSRAGVPKKVWSIDGKIAEQLPQNAGLDPDLIDLLSDEMQMDTALKHLNAFSLVQRNTSGGRMNLSIHTLVQHVLSTE
jgi:hypothetical protein